MAHEYAKDAKASHAKKLKSYGASDKESTPKNWAGFDALNTDKQAGRAPTSSTEYEAPERRIQKKKGGAVSGAASLKRLDKAPRKGKASGGARVGKIPSPDEMQEEFDETVEFTPGEMSPGTMRKKGGKVQDYEARSHESQGSQGFRPRQGHKRGGSAAHEGHMSRGEKYGAARTAGETKGELDSAMRALKYGDKAKAEKELGRAQGHTRKTEYYTGRAKGGKMHEDEVEDRMLVKKMVKSDALTGKAYGGRAKRADGGALGDGSSEGKKTPMKGKTTVNIVIGGIDDAAKRAMQAPAMTGMTPGPSGQPMMPPPPPPMMGAPGGMPPMMPPGGAPPMGPPPGMPPLPRKDGGAVQVPYKKPGRKGEYPAMDFGSGSGFGRKQKVDAYGTKGPSSKDNY